MSSFDAEQYVTCFNGFFSGNSINVVLENFESMCRLLQANPRNPREFLDKVHLCLRDARLFRLKSLVQKFDRRFSSAAYANARGTPVENANVLIVGSGPAGLRTAIECVFLGCKNVVVIEKRAEFSRNNIVHLWSFVIRDLIELGAKIFFPKFCTGDLDHISIKLLQLILLKTSLLLGVRFYSPCEFADLDKETCRPIFNPASHELSEESFDVIVGATGTRSVLPGFQFAEDRRALAIGITANFKNKNTLPEQQASEISGVARQFNAQFFDELNSYSGIDIENLVYYKGDTHYFVCTARKGSLLMKGVLSNDYPETDRLLARSNVAQYNLCNYMRELANICTAMTIPDLEYEMCGDTEDTAIFDFTSSCYAKHSCRAIIKPDGQKLLLCLVGDSLRLPFWPEGTGCPRGFLSSYDTAWLIQNWFSSITPIECIALRECVYGLYSSTKPDVLYKNFTELERFHLDPQTRYRQLDLSTAHVHLPKARALIDGVVDVPETPFACLFNANKPAVNGRRRNEVSRNAPGAIPERLHKWCVARLQPYAELLPGLEKELSFFDGMALCCLLHSIRPSGIDLLAITPGPLAVETFLNAIFREFTIAPQLTASELMSGANHNALVRILLQLYSITSHAEKAAAAANDPNRAAEIAAKADKLKELGRGLRQTRKHQLAVEHLLFGGKEMSLEEKKMKLKELFLLGQANAASAAGSATAQGNKSPTAAVTQQEFEERRARLKELFHQDSGCKSGGEGDAKNIEVSESLRDRRDVLVRKLLGHSGITTKTDGEPITAAKLSGLLGCSTGAKKGQLPIMSVDVSQTTKKLLTSLSSTCITDEQKKLAAALFETRLLGQRRQTSLDTKEGLNRGPPPARLAPHLSVGDRKRQLLNSKAMSSTTRSTRPHPDESAHIPVLEMKDRLGIACDSHIARSIDPVEKSQMSISELAKRIASSSSQSHQPDRRPEYQIMNQDYQPCCYICDDRLYVTERMQVGQYAVHRDCFRCAICRRLLRWSSYASVETLDGRRTIFVCPSHVENNEVEPFLAQTSEKMGETHVESKKPASQAISPSEETKPVEIVSKKPIIMEAAKVEEETPLEESDEEFYFEIDEEEDDEELEGSVCSSIEEVELGEVTGDEASEREELPASEEDAASSKASSSAHQSDNSKEKSVELRGEVKIDSWLHNQLVQQRQQKLIQAKQAFLASSEPTSLPLPLSPDNKREAFFAAPPQSNVQPIRVTAAELEMECDSDAAVDESNSNKKYDKSILDSEVDALAKNCSDQLTISPSKSPQHGASSMKNMFTKLQRSLDASLAKLKSRSPQSHEQNTLPSPSTEVKIVETQNSDDSELSDSEIDNNSELPKWRRFANSILSGNWPRKDRRSESLTGEEHQQSTRNGASNLKKPRQRPDSVNEMLFGPNELSVNPTGDRSPNKVHKNGDHSGDMMTKSLVSETATEEVMRAAVERGRRSLSAFASNEDNKSKNPGLVRDATKLITELDRLENERAHLDEGVARTESYRVVPQIGTSSDQDVNCRRADIANRLSELLLKAKIIEIDADMDDLMKKYMVATQSSSRNSPAENDQSPENLMHQIAVLASDRDTITNMMTPSMESTSKPPRNGQDTTRPATQQCTSLA